MRRGSDFLGDLLTRYVAARGLKLKHLAAGVDQLSAMFTGRAPMDPAYMRRPALRHAYACYYAPLGAMKLAAVLGELEGIVPPPRGMVADVGGGPGTGLIGLLMAGAEPRVYTLVDRVSEVAEEAILFAQLAGQRIDVRFARLAPRADLALVMNLLGESAVPLPPADVVVIIEPALRENTLRLMERRDRWAAEGWTIAAPCPATPRCPMRADPSLWCHVEVPFPGLRMIDEIDRRVGLRKEALKFSYVVLTRGPSLSASFPGAARLVSNLHREKGKLWGWVCGLGGGLVRAELLRRDRGPDTRDFSTARRGDVFAPLTLDGRVVAARRVRRMRVTASSDPSRLSSRPPAPAS